MAYLGLDIAAGARLARLEQEKDWYRDPWGWPEFAWLEQNPEKLQVEEAVHRTARGFSLRERPHFHPFEIPKSRLAVRPAVVQDAQSRVIYLSAVDSQLDKLHSNLNDWVYGWRRRNEREIGDNRVEWPTYLGLFEGVKAAEFGLSADITSFFASIDISRLSSLLYERLGKTAPTDLIIDIVEAHDRMASRSGLPQRSYASAALAHAFLGPLDDTLESADVRLVTRWMDDISAVGDEPKLYQLHLALEARARQLGLELNSAKSFLQPAPALAAQLRLGDLKKIRVPIAVAFKGYDDYEFELDPETLLELEGDILAGRVHHPTIIRAILSSLVEYSYYERVWEWTEVAYRIPQHANDLGAYLSHAVESLDEFDVAESATTRLGQWVKKFLADGWASLDWVASQVMLSLPQRRSKFQLSTLNEWLASSDNLQKVAVAGQSLAALSPAECRDAIRSRIDLVSDPSVLRVMALSLLSAGDDRRTVEAVLARDARNSMTLAYLSESNWRVPQPQADFAGPIGQEG